MTVHVHESLGAYVLGALDPAETEAVREHLERCPMCAAECAELAKLPPMLDLAVAAGVHEHQPLAPAVEERVLDRFAREHGPTPVRRRLLPRRPLTLRHGLAFGGAAVAALAAVVVAVVLALGGGRESSGYVVTLHGTGPTSTASARTSLRSVPGGTVMRMWVRNLPDDPSAVYEVRCESPTWSASAGTFRVDRHGRAYVVLTTAARQGEYDVIRVMRRERDASGHMRLAAVLAGRLT